MGKRQLRVSFEDFISKMLDYANIHVSIVMKNNTTFYGKIEKTDDDYIFLKDHSRNIHKFHKLDIIEIIMDQETSF